MGSLSRTDDPNDSESTHVQSQPTGDDGIFNKLHECAANAGLWNGVNVVGIPARQRLTIRKLCGFVRYVCYTKFRSNCAGRCTIPVGGVTASKGVYNAAICIFPVDKATAILPSIRNCNTISTTASTTMAEPDPLQPGINLHNHGPRVTISGAIMLAATLLMIIVCFFNRYNAQTMHHPDSILILTGAALNVACFSIWVVAVNRGFGQHASKLTGTELHAIEKLFLVSLLLFFSSHGIIKISYNLLARKTCRSDRFQRVTDVLSGVIGLWTLSNVIVAGVALGQTRSPARPFFWASGIISALIVLGQLSLFLWIIWKTKTTISVKLQWSISMGAFVPLCLIAISLRLAYTPANYFSGDWTFDNVFQGMLFLIELNLVTITVLAPNLPVFFKKTSTGGVYFLPGEAVGGSKNDTRGSKKKKNTYMLSSIPWSTIKSEGDVYTSKAEHTVTFTTSQRSEGENRNKPSFDSDRILIRTSIEVERSLERERSGSQRSGEV